MKPNQVEAKPCSLHRLRPLRDHRNNFDAIADTNNDNPLGDSHRNGRRSSTNFNVRFRPLHLERSDESRPRRQLPSTSTLAADVNTVEDTSTFEAPHNGINHDSPHPAADHDTRTGTTWMPSVQAATHTVRGIHQSWLLQHRQQATPGGTNIHGAITANNRDIERHIASRIANNPSLMREPHSALRFQAISATCCHRGISRSKMHAIITNALAILNEEENEAPVQD